MKARDSRFPGFAGLVPRALDAREPDTGCAVLAAIRGLLNPWVKVEGGFVPPPFALVSDREARARLLTAGLTRPEADLVLGELKARLPALAVGEYLAVATREVFGKLGKEQAGLAAVATTARTKTSEGLAARAHLAVRWVNAGGELAQGALRSRIDTARADDRRENTAVEYRLPNMRSL